MVGGSLAALFGFGAPFYVVGGLALLFTPISLMVLPADGLHPPRPSPSPPPPVRQGCCCPHTTSCFNSTPWSAAAACRRCLRFPSA